MMIFQPEHHSVGSVNVLPSKNKRGGPYVTLTCDCECGTIFERPKSAVKIHAKHYFSRVHQGAHRSRVYLEDMCGSFLGITQEFLDFSAIQGYKDIGGRRVAVCHFMLFMNERGITHLELVKSMTITEFLTWAADVEYDSAHSHISEIAGFFRWAIQVGHRRSPCPVVPSFHRKKSVCRLPRPYEPDEMDLIWRLAADRGNTRIRAIIAIGEEAGLRLGEICRLRLQDVDLKGRRLFVRLPNKGDRERYAHFDDKTALRLSAWLAERDSECEHGGLFHNSLGAPLLPHTARREMCRTFCSMYEGKQIHEEGLEKWSTHRLRHTMASTLMEGGADMTTIMHAGGWKSHASMLIYAKIHSAMARRGYEEAMNRAEEQRRHPLSTATPLTIDEFLAANEKT